MACYKSNDQNISDATNDTIQSELELNRKVNKNAVSNSFLKKSFSGFIIVDFTLVQFVDETGCKCLKEVVKEYTNDGVKMFFTNCNGKREAVLLLFLIVIFSSI